MKILKVSDTTTGLGMYIKGGSLGHIQSAYKEVIDAIVKGSIGGSYDATKFYVLYGLVNSTTAPIYTVSAGAIFYNGEVYLVDAFTFTASNTAVGTITTTYFTGQEADPANFTDGTTRNVHEIRKIVFADATSGSGDVDFGDLIFSNTAKFFVGDSGNPAFQDNWVNWANNTKLFFQKINNDVIICGAIYKGTYTSQASTIFTLPTQYRPQRQIEFAGIAAYLSSYNWYRSGCNLDINPTNGLVNVGVDKDFLTAAQGVSTDWPRISFYIKYSLL